MNWLPRKLILSQIKKYFHIENEQQVQVELMGSHHLTCSNLRLRNALLNQPHLPLHVTLLTINTLSLSYDKTRDEPIQLILDGAKLVLAFNPHPVRPSTPSPADALKPFFAALASKDLLKQRGFLAQQVYQLKNLLGEFLLGKVSLLVRNVDISLQYEFENETRVLGFELGEVNIKQRMVINHEGSAEEEMREEEIICSLEAVSLYLGVSSEEDRIEQLAQNREILRKTKTIKKIYLLEKERINIYFNISKNSLSLNIKEINFRFNKLITVQILKIAHYLQKHLSDRPILRPGKGDIKSIDCGTTRIKMKEGTFQWWGYLLRQVVAKLQDKKEFKILTNQKYRLYLFYLFYRYTYGSSSAMDDKIRQYEENKLPYSIMNTYSMVLSKIKAIRESDGLNDQYNYFINFISASKLVVEASSKLGLKKLTYEKIRKSSIFFNLKNCSEYIREFSHKANITILVNIDSRIRVNVFENKYDNNLIKEGFTLDPVKFYELKNKYVNKYYKKMAEEGLKADKLFLMLDIFKLMVSKTSSELKITIPSITLENEDHQILFKVNSLALIKENKVLTEANTVILTEKNQFLKINSIFINIHKSIATHLLTIKLLLSDDLTKPITEQEQFDSFLESNIYRRLPKHPYFENYSDQSMTVEVDKIIIVTSAFEDNQYLTVETTGLVYSCPINSKSKISLDKLSVERNKITSFDKIRHSKLQKMSMEQQSLILENNKPLKLSFDKMRRRDENSSYKYFESVTDIIIPFLLIQISFQDIYYLMLMLNYWKELIDNQYFFPKRRGKTQLEKKLIELKPDKIQYFQKLNKFTKSERNRVHLEGIQLIVYGQNKRQNSNEILSLLIEGISYQNKVYILGQMTSISILNIFVENCLGKKTFNFQKLKKLIQQKIDTKEPLIFNSKEESSSNSLIIYGMNDIRLQQSKKAEKVNLIDITIKNTFSLHHLRKNSDVRVEIQPLFIYHSPDFYQILLKCFGLISETSRNNHKAVAQVVYAGLQEDSDHEILEAKNITEKMVFRCNIDRINLIVLHQLEPIYTISFIGLSIKHETEAYVTKVETQISELFIVDISVNCGLHPIVFKAVPMICYYTKYDSELLRRKEKKSALLEINFEHSEIYYLNRKIKELVNFIMDNFNNEVKQENQNDSRMNEEHKDDKMAVHTYPFCYRIDFKNPILVLIRSSLSQEKMLGQIDRLIISNYEQQADEQDRGKFFFDGENNYRNDSFESCIEIKEEHIKFLSFEKQQLEEKAQKPTIYINLTNLYIFNHNKQLKNAIMVAPEINITLKDKVLDAQIPIFNMDFTQDDYRLLIRITEQNFGQAPVSYPKDSILADQKNVIGFKSDYFIGKIQLAMRQKRGNDKMGELIIQNLHGQNIMYTNGEKDDNIDIDTLQYVSCINHDLENIIVKKSMNDLDSQDRTYLDWDEKRRMKKCNHFDLFASQFKEEEEDEKIAQKFFKDQTNSFEIGELSSNDERQNLTMRGGQSNRRKKEETHLGKIGKWIGGMCKKCMCCCKKTETNDTKGNQEDQSHRDSHHPKLEDQLRDLIERDIDFQPPINLQDSNIECDNQMIGFSSKISPGDQYIELYKQRDQKIKNKSKSIIMRIHGEKSREKRMQMLVRHLDIFYEKNQHIMSLINFLNKPYSEPEKPHYLREAKFNNFRPFQMMIELYNSSVFIKQKETINEKYIELDLRMTYNIERVGDTKSGPGKNLTEVDLIFAMLFHDAKIEKSVPLSDSIRLLYEKETIVTYHHRQEIKNKERLLMFGENNQKVRFNIPVFIINSLMDLFKDFTAKNKEKQDPIPPIEEQFKKEKVREEKMEKKKEEKKVESSKMTTKVNSKTDKSYPNSKENKLEIIKEEEQPDKKLKVDKSKTIRTYFIPKFQIDVQSKLNTSFISVYMGNIHFKNVQMVKDYHEVKDQIINMDMNVDYWNLNLGKFEPFLENCKFSITTRSQKRDNTQINRIKVLSKSEIDNNSYDYRKGLCINLSTAFFHTYKQLELKYLLGNEDQELFNQICYDLTKKNKQVYEYMQMVKKLDVNDKEASFLKKYPEELKNFFGRQFKIQDLNELTKKKSKRSHIFKNKFHIEGLKVFLYHSYLEAKTKMKNITYRTPFRIYNMVQYKLMLRFGTASAKHDRWEHELDFRQYYSIPEDIYDYDFLINISAIKKTARKDHMLGLQRLQSSIFKKENTSIEFEDTMSVKYLIQMHANKSEYHEMEKHKLHEYLFNLSNIQKRLIDRRDILIKSTKFTFSVINIKTECEHLKDKFIDGSKIILYDSLTIIISPIIIYNYTILNFNLISCREKKYELASGKAIQLNQFPRDVQVKDIVVEFAEDIVHNEYHFLDINIETRIKTMLIDRMQSINIKIIKETYNTCTVQLYPDWLIINQTELEFQLEYEKKEFPIDQKSMSSLTIQEWANKSNNKMKIKLYDIINPNENTHKFTTETDLIDIFTLIKVQKGEIKNDKEQLNTKGCCGSIKPRGNVSYPSKKNDERVFKCIELVLTIQQSPYCKLTRNLIINYKYLIVNDMDYQLCIYQYACGQIVQSSNEQGLQLMRLAPKEQRYLYTYDFLPKEMYVKICYESQFVTSNLFTCDDSIGRSLSIKLKRNNQQEIFSTNIAYHDSFHYVRIDTQQNKYTTLLNFSLIDDKKVKHPFYINNVTNYFVKVTENGQSFKIKPKTKVPFSWSNLIDNTHEIEIEIQGNTQVYSLKQKSQFEPIVIKGDNYGRTNRTSINRSLFKRQKCKLKWEGISGQFLLVFDIFSKKLHINAGQAYTLNMNDAQRMINSHNKIQIYFKNRQVFEFSPSQSTFRQWVDILMNDLNNNVIDKISFTIESIQNSIIFFLHNMDIASDNDVKLDHKEFKVENFYISIINSNPIKTEEVLLINMEDIEYILENRFCRIKEKDQNYFVKKFDQCFKIKKLKINNQLDHALNPVILSQIKKSNYPFLELKRQKQNLLMEGNQNSIIQEQIDHYKSNIFFLDEAELMIEAALIPQILNLKKSIDQINNQYSYDLYEVDQIQQESRPSQNKKINTKQIYIDYMEIKPIKMTISVSFDANIDKQFEPKLMNFLTLIPAGVENAIIAVDSYIFHHVFLEERRLRQTLKQYYLFEMKKQILYNAGSIQIFAPIQLVQGLGIGVKNIFYNPFYEFVHTKQIKNFTSTLIEGIITFFVLMLTVGFQFLNGIFKFIAYFTFDRNFQSRREMFRRQIFKSPLDGLSYGGRYLVRGFKEFFLNFVQWPCQYNNSFPCLGLIFGFLLAILNIVPWIIKVLVTTYDFFYVIGLGIISWGYYEQNSMKYRSRPIRTFPHKQLNQYDFLTAKGNQIMRKNQIEENDNEQITFISHMEAGDQTKYLVLSNYRILYCSHQLSSFKEIQLYRISRVIIQPILKDEISNTISDLYITVELSIPDKGKFLCFESSVNQYEIKFKDLKTLKDFLTKLKQNLQIQSLQFNLLDENLTIFEKGQLPQ